MPYGRQIKQRQPPRERYATTKGTLFLKDRVPVAWLGLRFRSFAAVILASDECASRVGMQRRAPLRESVSAYLSPNQTCMFPSIRLAYAYHGARLARVHMRLASSAPMKHSLSGSKRSVRPSLHAIPAAWHATCDERMTRPLALVSPRDFTQSKKFLT